MIDNSINEIQIPDTLVANYLRLRKLAAEIILETSELPFEAPLRESAMFGENFNLYMEVRNYEIKLIKRALRLARGSQVKATKILGIKRSTLNNKIKVYQIQHGDS